MHKALKNNVSNITCTPILGLCQDQGQRCKLQLIYSDIKRNEIELFVVRWMDLESVIQSEVSQKEKNKYRMLTHIYGI